ncbi:Gfo/Idh/MocA family oxidoreductase [Bacillus tianshenii]|nr:Gfo/Idh/MocA family oxidoreductase [Bacillus tianshenii]
MVNFAIIGCGHIAKKHAEAIRNTQNAKLVAVCDKIENQMNYYVEKYSVQPYTDLNLLLQQEEVDVVNICTPSGSHAPITVSAAEAKKHVIVEKPIALDVKDAQLMIETCKSNNVKLAVLHPNRFRPAMLELKKLLEDGCFGKLSHVNATVRWNRNEDYYNQAPWRGTKEHDGGVLMNQAIHNLDLLLWLIGELDEVYSMSATRFRDIEAEDVSTGVIRFSDGTLGVVEAATTIYPKNLEETISIFGEKGTIKIGGPTASYIEHCAIDSIDKITTKEIINKVNSSPFGKPGHQWIVEDMVNAIIHNREPIVDGKDGMKALQFVTTMYEAAETGQAVKLKKL